MAEENIVIKIKADVGISKEVIESVTKAMEGLGKTATIVSGNVKVTNKNLEDTNKILGQVGETAKKTGNAIGRTGDSVKKSNMQWTNLALVVQDLPYGFRGIQNNLPALMGGIAGMAGPLYLVGSAVIALFTAWDAGLFKTKNATDALKKSQEEFDKSLKSSLETGYSEISSIKALVAVAKDHTTSMDNRLLAVKKLQDEYPAYFGNLSQEKILNGDLTTAINGVSNALLARAEATALEGKMGVLATEKLANEEKLFQLALEKTKRLKSHKAYLASPFVSKKQRQEDAKKDMIGIMLLDIRTKEAELTQRNLNIQKEALTVQEKINKLTVTALPLETKKGKDVKVKEEKDKYFNLLSYTEEYYRAKMNFAYGDLEKQKEILKEEGNAYLGLYGLRIISDIDYAKKSSEIYKKLSDIKQKEDQDLINQQIAFAKRQTTNIETELSVQDRLNKNSLSDRIEYTKQALAKLAVLAAYTFDPKVLAVYLDSFDKVNAKLKGMGTAWEATSNQIKNLIEGVMSDSISQFAENIGKSFNGEDVDIFGGITEIIATGLQNIGKALIAYGTAMDAFKLAFTNPFAAIAAGVVLVATGAALQGSVKKMNDSGTKTKKFANGGIISGPTMGLMGEYPGARTNPEVVAPLDKLKDMIGGGGGGTFMLRGQDLLLSVNRAQKASNLKGQNISLA